MGLSVPGCWPHIVVLLAEDVDRNTPEAIQADKLLVVLLAEDVDRNASARRTACNGKSRPPRGGRG